MRRSTMFARLRKLSRYSHWLIRGHDESWCSYAYRHQEYTPWRLFVAVMTESHCRKSYEHYHGDRDV